MDMFMLSAIIKVIYEERIINHRPVNGATEVTFEYLCREQEDEVFADRVREEKIRLEQTKKLGFNTTLISDLDYVLRWEYEDNDGVVHGTRLYVVNVELGDEKRVDF